MTEVLTCEALKADRDAQQKRADALTVENAAQGAALSLISGCYGLSPHIQSMCAVETPATDAALAVIRADAMAEGAEACVRALVTSDDDDFTDAPNICAIVACQLREAK